MSLSITINTGKKLDRLRVHYPASSIIAIITTVILMYMVHSGAGTFFRWPLTGFIGFLAFFNLETIKNRGILSTRFFIILSVAALILLILFYINIPVNYTQQLTPFWFFTIGLGIILHFTATLIPSFTRNRADVYIPYNIRLFVCWTQSTLYAVLLYVALLLAMLALQVLFGFQSNPNMPITLFIFVTGIFQTLYFLSEITEEETAEALQVTFPILRFITIYAGIPIIILYSIILHAYIGKLMIEEKYPVDWSKEMTIWYLGVGILVYLISKYFEKIKDQTWMILFRKYYFYAAIFPLGLLWYATISSIGQKGINDQLYLSALLAIWTSFITVFSLFNWLNDKRFISISAIALCTLAFTNHPLSMYQLPISYQQKELIEALSKADIIKNGIIQVDTNLVIKDQNLYISEKLHFLESRNALNFLKKYDPNALLGDEKDSLKALNIMNKLGIITYRKLENNQPWHLYKEQIDSIDIRAYDVMYPLAFEKDHLLPENGIISDKYGSFIVKLQGRSIDTLNALTYLKQLIRQPDEEPVILIKNDKADYFIILQNASGEIKKDTVIVTSMRGWVLFKRK